MNKKRAIATITACGLVAAMALGGSLAYLTDNESHTNTVQVSGNVRVDLVEPKWDETDEDHNGIPDPAQETVPNQEIKKDPKVVNTGENPCFVFIRMTVPVKEVTRVRDDGTLVTKDNNVEPLRLGQNGEKIYHQPQDVFYFKQTNDAEGMHANNFNAKWKRLKDREYNVEVIANADGSASSTYNADQVVGQAVYVFGYEDELPPTGDSTETNYGYTTTLYDKIQIKNVLENELTSDQIQNIKIETFAIQSDNLLLGADETHTGTKWTKKRGLTAAELQNIYDVFVKQNGTFKEGTPGQEGDFEWNTFQDNQHGQSEKEAEISNERNLKDDGNNNVTSFANNTQYGAPLAGQTHNGTDLLVGESGRFNYTLRSQRSGAEIRPSFTSSNPEVVEIDAQTGVYTAKKKGNATLTVTIDGVKASIQVNVMNDSRNPDGNTAVPSNDGSDIPNGTTEPVPNTP
jgi:predicted ribosomally synthesized peptide with SipW-like signal peptide